MPKPCEIGSRLLLITNRNWKSHIDFQMTQKSFNLNDLVTLDDLEDQISTATGTV